MKKNITRVAVIKDGKVLRTYPSIVDTSIGEGIDYSWLFKALKKGNPVKGVTYVRTSYQHTPIVGMKGEDEWVYQTLEEASEKAGLTQFNILYLIDSGDGFLGWTFDEIGEEAYPLVKFVEGKLYRRCKYGYKAQYPTTFLHRDIYEAVYGSIEGQKVHVRNANRWNFTLDDLVVRE